MSALGDKLRALADNPPVGPDWERVLEELACDADQMGAAALPAANLSGGGAPAQPKEDDHGTTTENRGEREEGLTEARCVRTQFSPELPAGPGNVPGPALSYQAFLEAKTVIAPRLGFDVDPADINPALKPHIRAIVPWLLEGGRRALFARFGLQKTTAHLEFCRLALGHVMHQLDAAGAAFWHAGALIALPLGARLSFFHDAQKYFTGAHAVRLKFIRTNDEIERQEPGQPLLIHLTNFESIREGKVDPRRFQVATLDEGDVLRAFGATKTARVFKELFGDIAYRLVATATPDPNEYIELLAYAAFLGIMDVGEAKTRFFKRDSTKADKLTLHPHKEREFWLWVASWALFIQKPSDLGPEFSDEGYALPDLDIRWHEIPTDHSGAGEERDGQKRLIRNAAIGVQEASAEKRASLEARVAKLMELRAELPDAHRILWHDLEAEREALEEAIPEFRYERWLEVKDGHPQAVALYDRHYSAREYADGRERKLILGPGDKLVLVTAAGDALFGWRKFIDDSGQTGVNCAVFRNEGPQQSSELIREAMAIAWLRWPGERLYTYVDAEKTSARRSKKGEPGQAFIHAGWRRCGDTKGGLVILEALPGPDVLTVERRRQMATVYGAQDLEGREQTLIDFAQGKIPELAGKPMMIGSGPNFQFHCWWEIFLGIGFKFKDTLQAIHRVQRYGQCFEGWPAAWGPPRVRVDLIYTEAERETRRNLEGKWKRYEEQAARMAAIIREFGLAKVGSAGALARTIGCERVEIVGGASPVAPARLTGANAKGDAGSGVMRGEGLPHIGEEPTGPASASWLWKAVNNDCVLETRAMADNSVDLIITSIPFSTQYEYSPSYNDFGHSDNDAHFWQQMDFLVPELLRVLKPGRVAAIHVKDRIVPGGINGLGFQTVSPFSDDCVASFRKHGFGFMARKTVVTDVVRENNQTYRLGWTEQCKDGTKMGAGLPEYVLLFRKPPTDRSNGYADVPVVKEKPWCDDNGTPAPFDKRNNWRKPIEETGYSRARWQFDAHGFTRSSGDRLLSSAELRDLPHDQLYKLWRDRSLDKVYDFAGHLAVAAELDRQERLPSTFMLFPPHSWHPDVWTDITRMRTLNGAQHAAGKELHLCPLQFDIVDRLIVQLSMEGETVLDPFGGLMTVPYCAIKLKRRGLGVELNPGYFRDGVSYLQAAEREMAVPTLFALMGVAETPETMEAAE